MRRGALLIGGAIAAAVMVFVLTRDDSGAELSVLLRCEQGVAGTLVVQSNERTATADVVEACSSGAVTLGGYEQGQDLSIAYTDKAGTTSKLQAVYGRDIQSSPDGFFAVISLASQSPRLANEKL